MGLLWDCGAIPAGFPWDSCRIHVGFVWGSRLPLDSCGIRVGLVWGSCWDGRIPVGFLRCGIPGWIPVGFPWGSHLIPCGYLWGSHGIHV